jgi:hypothetical protein
MIRSIVNFQRERERLLFVIDSKSIVSIALNISNIFFYAEMSFRFSLHYLSALLNEKGSARINSSAAFLVEKKAI